MVDFAFEAIGTQWVVEVFDAPADMAGLQTAVHKRIEHFDKRYSRFRGDSLVSHLARQAGSHKIPADGQPMLALYRSLYDVTNGAVTPLIGQALSDAGYDAAYSLQPRALTPVPAWDDVLKHTINGIHLRQPALLDFGALGKGRLVDLVAAIVRRYGSQSFCINAGGDIYHYDMAGTVIEIALEHPTDVTSAIGIARLGNGSLCGSAGNRRAWAGYHHILDPVSLHSPQHLRAIWVTAGSTMLADGLSTALFFCPASVLREHFVFEYAAVLADGSLRKSAGFPAEFFV